MGEPDADHHVEPFAFKADFVQIISSVNTAWSIYTRADAIGGT